MTQTTDEATKALFKARIRRSAFFGLLCAMFFMGMVYLNVPDVGLMDLFAGGTVLGLFGLVCWLWPSASVIYMLLLGLTLFGSSFWSSPFGWLGAGVMTLPGIVPFLLFVLPAFGRWISKR